MLLAGFLVAINLFKVLVAPAFPLIGDEAFYWLWAQHLDFGYFDHPPMVGYVNFIITSLAGNSPLAVRLTAILIVLLISGVIYLIAEELYGQKAAQLAVIVFNLIPTFFGGGLILVPQTIFFLFWSLAFYLLVKIIKTGRGYYWLILGVTAGLGLLSDYIMVFFFLGTALYLIITADQRRWLTRPEPYLGLLISLIITSPMVHWYFTHLYLTLNYQSGRAGHFGLNNILYFIILQMIMFTPPIFLAAAAKVCSRKFDLAQIFTGAVLVPFALLSPIAMIGGHWLSTAYLPSILESFKQKRWVFITTLVFALVINALAFTYYVFLYPTVGLSDQTNRELPAYLKSVGPAYVYTNNLGLSALVAFHGQTKAYMTPGRHAQYDYWGRPALKRGDNVIYFALNESELPAKLKPLFKSVIIEPHKRIFTKDADIPSRTEIIICRNYRGAGALP